MCKSPIITCITIFILLIPGLLGCESKTKAVEPKPKVISKKIDEKVKQEPSPIKNESADNAGNNVAKEESKEKNDVDVKTVDSNDIDKKAVDQDESNIDIKDDEIAVAEYEQVEFNEDQEDEPIDIQSIENSENGELAESSRVDDEKRKAAELLASIHQEVSSINGEEKNSLDTLSNPFLPLFSDSPVNQESEKPKSRKRKVIDSPITKVDLSQLKLVATLRASSGNKALVEDSTGKGYVVDIGTPIGINYGKVVEINDDSVMVDEEIETLTGDIKIQRREIKLQKAPGE